MKVLVVLSGGQDSTTCLFWAKHAFPGAEIHAITFNYNQRHKIEIDAAVKVAALACVASHEIIDLGPVLKGTSPLVSDNPVGHYKSANDLPGGIEPTFVPARNLLFLTIAGNRAAVIGAKDIVTGVCQEDFGGYPDCRRVFIEQMQEALSEGIAGKRDHFYIHTPLMNLTKKDSVILAKNTPGAWDALAFTHTCYDGQYPPNPNNHASLLRARGFHEAQLPDPLIQRAKAEGLLPAEYPDDGLVETAAPAAE